MYLTFFHDGQFFPDSYVEGQRSEVEDYIDPDRFGFTDVAEYIKTTLGYTEIGGVYVKKSTEGWKLVTDDKDVQSFIAGFDEDAELEFYIDNVVDLSIEPLKQMQPHVVMRPRADFVQGTKLPPKRKYVTLDTFKKQEEQKTKMTRGATVHRKLEVDKSVGVEKDRLAKIAEKKSYQAIRDRNIQANKERLAALNLPLLVGRMTAEQEGKQRVEEIDADGSDDYCPSNDSDEENSCSLSLRTKSITSRKTRGQVRATQSKSETTKKGDNVKFTSVAAGKRTTRNKASTSTAIVPAVRLPSSPTITTRSQQRRVEMEGSTSVALPSRRGYKRATVSTTAKAKDKIGLAPSSPAANTRLKRRKNDNVNSTAQEEQEQIVNEPAVNLQTAAENEVQESEEPATNTEVLEKKKRGKTKMVAVHSRKPEERKKISLNEKFQPICDQRKDRAEFSLFLGTIAREYVSLDHATWHKVPNKDMLWEFVKEKYIIPEEGKHWVLRAIRDAWKVYKCRIKKAYYEKFTNDEDRLKHKPTDIPMEVFKNLLKYWGDEKVKATAARNAANRRRITDTHTVGPRSFAQIRKEMSTTRDGQEPSLAEIFIETRKRQEGKTYKTKTDVINYRISTLKDMCSSGANSESVEQLMLGDTPHGPSWLVGRLAVPRKCKASSSSQTGQSVDVDELTAKIKEKLQMEMEETVKQQVKENLAVMVKQFAEDNPGLTLNFASLGISDDHVAPQEE